MIKRKFGMQTLRISQSRFNGFSHKDNNAYDLVGKDSGIESFFATHTYRVVVIYKFNYVTKSGFANTVHFYDEENDITLALTHANNIDNLRVGFHVKLGTSIYKEGMSGRATGNHIHLEIGKGLQTKKKNINGTYKLINQINIEDYFYIDETVNVLDTKGIQFEVRKSGEEDMNFGYYEINEESNVLKLYFQKPNLRLGLISAAKDNTDYKALQTIDKLDDERRHYFKVNGGYFQMSGPEHGQHYGVEVNHKVSFIPRQKGYEVIYLLKNEDKLKICNASEYYFNQSDVDFAITPYSIIYFDGEYINKISLGIGNKESIKNTQTFLIQLKSNQCILGTFENKLYPNEVANWAKNKFKDELSLLALFDSGGSSQCVLAGVRKLYTGRAIANALTFYEAKKNISFVEDTKPADAPQEDTKEKELETLKTEVIRLTEENKKLKDIIKKAQEVLSV